MIVKNNYNECLTNLACSIRKYFDLEYKHNTLNYIDKILEEKQPKNVVLILFDGMGSRILNRTLEKDSFFITKTFKEITTVFPATTTAATTSIRTGLNPVEHGWLGWNTYISPINKTITLFRDTEKGKKDICKEFLENKKQLITETITEEINKTGTYRAMELLPFGENKYEDLDNMIEIIKNETKKEGKKFIYAYDNDPDHTMHNFGPDSNQVKELIQIRNNKIKELCDKLEDTLVIITADHGHKKVNHIFLNDYPEILDMLERTTSIEQRAVSFKIKSQLKEKFKNEFNNLFGKDFSLYEKEDIIKSNLFGDGQHNELFEEAIGDFIAIAENSDKCILMDGDEKLYSQHAGYTEDEIYVPLIIIDKK